MSLFSPSVLQNEQYSPNTRQSKFKHSLKFLLEESTNMIKKKKYKKAYQHLERFSLNDSTMQNIELQDKLDINSRVLYCLIKIVQKYLTRAEFYVA